MTAIYPNDAIFNPNSFPVLGTVTYTSTGFTTDFNLSVGVDNPGAVVAFADGVLQDTTTYFLVNNGATASFFSPPNVDSLTLKSVKIPARFVKTVSLSTTVRAATFSNDAVTTINSNNYIVDGETTVWALPGGVSVSSKDELMVAVSGALQVPSNYTFPSASPIGNQGIDLIEILDNDDILDIRVFTTSTSGGTDRAKSMVDRKPNRGFQEDRKFDISSFESQAGYEKRRLRSRRGLRSWRLTYSALSGMERLAIEDFYNNRFGEWQSFLFDLDHINESGFATVRFDGKLVIQYLAQRSSQNIDKYFTINITLKEINS